MLVMDVTWEILARIASACNGCDMGNIGSDSQCL